MQFVFSVLLVAVYIAIGVTDFKRHIIPNSFLICLIFFTTVRAALQEEWSALVKSLVGAVYMMLICIVVYGFCRMIKKPDIFGAGDYKYLVALGYCYGIDRMAKLCAFAFVAALVVYIVSLMSKKSLAKIAAAPYLSLGAVIVELII